MTILAATPQAIAEAAAALRAGRLVAFPTETVYGLGADATNARAVAAIFEAKGRPRFNPLITHAPSLDVVASLGRLTDTGHRLAAAFWPGPLTLVLPKLPGCPVADLATAGLDTIAIRIPAHPIGRALLEAAGVPIAAPSANRSGHVSPTTAAHVATDLGDRVAMILDGGATPVGLESTVIDVTGERAVILRLGGIARNDIARVLGYSPALAGDENVAPSSPGMLERHYAPATRLRLDAREARAGEALLAFGAAVPPHAGPAINLSPSGDLAEAAATLFAALRSLDAAGATAIAVMSIPAYGLGEAINDRLRRAATAE
ncbi:MAG: threonylcarbamoyl-AMP synthase [Hyphomonadaceae bacterium]|jgi:L-threonylcarbamoyladenylate synthase|nr:threonylcarbamoyl-AMP synthase [Hyphomonadaceae bacterium]